MKSVTVFLMFGFLTAASQGFAQSKFVNPTLFASEAERCIVPASQFHGVNPFILRAILRVESGLKPNAIGKNKNGSVDIGIGQMNSIHFKDLAKYGIGRDQLKDACIGTYVAAWHLKKGMLAHGNTWEAIARYHSATPYFNNRYQILLGNELIRSKTLSGLIQAVPPLHKGSDNTSTGSDFVVHKLPK